MKDFIRYTKKRNLSLNTIRTYESVLKHYEPVLDSWIKIRNKIINSNFKPRTIHLHKNVLLSFFEFKKLKRYLQNLKLLKLPQIEMKYFDVISKNNLYKKTDILDDDSLEIKKYKTIIRFLFETGIRAHELFFLEPVNNRLYVLGKGNKKRQIFFVKQTFEQLQKFYENLKGFETTKTLRLYIKKIIGKNFTPHSLRRSFATFMLIKGANPKTVMLQMGHANIQTTFSYLNLNEQTNRRIYNKIMYQNDAE
ncbi:tyrosine-type recombinase/integrase [Ureaplasma urealyticum]|uniref:Site-specific integrase n=3 Tax=Ureaplasma urealyticum TaxID=2130 RepID=A0AAP9ACW0_UREUR|nr:site-specific integrase [Ureaplasma urealyticum]EDX53877.1 tyrosine recombinase XerC [Ureaplasma urealyticum serovar 9 str. ATCC 33175]ACI60177.1 tyrosine recombinase XerC [Ureaplasma urealyticum serovar 10 str. ATCC 33699]EDU06509.1 site-specific recombinase, phage integrase family protein [Ureaplasma urealyticum serovar 5 str. ATCC 27817]EDU56903.1 site-specific recombinase, phage integrase family protein [Ureaplasma urealyticum serovar 7 str. ATCC 27819]EDU66979.1 site-specific recombina